MLKTKKPGLIWQGFSILIIGMFLSGNCVDVFASQARLLSDEELDGVHAEGIFFESELVNPAATQAVETNIMPVSQQNQQIPFADSSISQELGLSESSQANSGITVSPVGNGSYNVVVVDDLAQQNLSSLVNVNAAGSVVPILLNITININSTVESISNQNSLDLNNYYQFNK
jgi:hypothetical protein